MRTNGKTEDLERKGLPSASSAARFEDCHASYLLEQRARELGQVAHEGGQAATRGEIIHQWLAGEKVSLSPADLELAQFLRERGDFEAKRIFGDRKPKMFVEKRLWMKQGNKALLSGRFDRVFIDDNLALVQDYKTGHSLIEEATVNRQLKWLAVLTGINAPLVDEVVVQLISRTRPTEARYKVRDLEKAYNEVHTTLTKLFDKTSQPTPGPSQCQWCPAALICPALNKLVDEVPSVSQAKVKPLPGGGKAAADILDVIEVLENRYAEIKEFYTKVLKETPDAIPGWQLVPGSSRRDVTDWQAATARLVDYLPEDEIKHCASWKLTELEALLGQELGLSPKDARAKFDEILNGLIEKKPTAPSLKRIKETL